MLARENVLYTYTYAPAWLFRSLSHLSEGAKEKTHNVRWLKALRNTAPFWRAKQSIKILSYGLTDWDEHEIKIFQFVLMKWLHLVKIIASWWFNFSALSRQFSDYNSVATWLIFIFYMSHFLLQRSFARFLLTFQTASGDKKKKCVYDCKNGKSTFLVNSCVYIDLWIVRVINNLST